MLDNLRTMARRAGRAVRGFGVAVVRVTQALTEAVKTIAPLAILAVVLINPAALRAVAIAVLPPVVVIAAAIVVAAILLAVAAVHTAPARNTAPTLLEKVLTGTLA